jgi:hypothetical protein
MRTAREINAKLGTGRSFSGFQFKFEVQAEEMRWQSSKKRR